MIPSTPSPGKMSQVSSRKTLSWYAHDFARDAVRQLFGQRSSSKPTVYWSKDKRGNWVVHIPMYRK